MPPSSAGRRARSRSRCAVESIVSPDGEVVVGWSALGRELSFVVSHTIHHRAMIAVLLGAPGAHAAARAIRLRAIHAADAVTSLMCTVRRSAILADPDRSLLSASRRLFQHWSIVFAIGAANRAAGATVTPTGHLIAPVRAHLTYKPAFELSD